MSAMAARADVASLDYADGEPYWLPPGRKDVPALVQERQSTAAFDAGEGNLAEALTFLGQLRSDLPTGAFVFVLSDFLAPPSADAWLDASRTAGTSCPSSSGPRVGTELPGRRLGCRPGRGSAQRAHGARPPVAPGSARAAHTNERRLADLLAELVSLGLEPVLLGTSDPFEIDRAFIEWAELRRVSRWAR
jgi:hypothetical protein